MSLVQELWELYPNGTALNSTNIGLYGTAGMTNAAAGSGTMATQTTDAADGISCLQCDWPTGQAGQFAIPDTAAADAVCAFAYKLLAFPTAAADHQFPIGARYSAGQLGRLETNITGQFRASMTSLSSYGTALSLNTWYRVECQIIGAGTTSTAFNYFVYTTPTGTTLLDSGGVSGVNTSALGQVAQWRWGRLSAQTGAISYKVDTMRSNIGSSTLLGPPPATALTRRPLFRNTAAVHGALR